MASPRTSTSSPSRRSARSSGSRTWAGYLYDIQITTAPVSDGSLSSCPPAEAVTWGKVDKDAYRSTCVSLLADYTTVMPFLSKALLDKRARFERWAGRMGAEALFEKHPEARGYLRASEGYRLMDRRRGAVREASCRRSEQREGPDACRDLKYTLAPLEPTPTRSPS